MTDIYLTIFKCFNVNFRLLKTIYVHLLVCYWNRLQNARCNDKDNQLYLFQNGDSCDLNSSIVSVCLNDALSTEGIIYTEVW